MGTDGQMTRGSRVGGRPEGMGGASASKSHQDQKPSILDLDIAATVPTPPLCKNHRIAIADEPSINRLNRLSRSRRTRGRKEGKEEAHMY